MSRNNRKRVDFTQLYKNYDHDQRSMNPVIVFAIVLAVLVVVAGGYFTYSVYQENETLKKEIKEAEEYITDPSNIAIVNEVLEKDAQILSLQMVSDDLDSMKEIIDLYPDYDFEFRDALEYEGVDFNNITFYTSGISIEATCDEISTITEYVRYLKDTGLFYSVGYYGFELDENDYAYMITAVIARGDNNE